ncbi:MAG: cysteine hydrolase, partial [Pseudonocardiales bacterium]
MVVDPKRAAVLALHWQVNVIKPEGFFGSVLSEPIVRSGVVERAARFHRSVRAAGVPVIFTLAGNGLSQWLTGRGIDTVFLTGVATNL